MRAVTEKNWATVNLLIPDNASFIEERHLTILRREVELSEVRYSEEGGTHRARCSNKDNFLKIIQASQMFFLNCLPFNK